MLMFPHSIPSMPPELPRQSSIRIPTGPCLHILDLSGVSAHRLHGFGRVILQNTFRRGGIRRGGSADHLGRLEEHGRGDRQAQRLGGLLLWPRSSILRRALVYSGLGIVTGFLGVVVIGAITR
jgi:hypothetical protein